MSKQAYITSDLAFEETLVDSLGLRKDINLEQSYYETISGGTFSRTTRDQDARQEGRIPEVDEAGFVDIPENIYGISPLGWLMRGSIREDDFTGINTIICGVAASNVPEDGNPNINRPYRHFFDPVHDDGLFFVFDKSVDWAFGSDDALANENQKNTSRTNHFTIVDALVSNVPERVAVLRATYSSCGQAYLHCVWSRDAHHSFPSTDSDLNKRVLTNLLRMWHGDAPSLITPLRLESVA